LKQESIQVQNQSSENQTIHAVSLCRGGDGGCSSALPSTKLDMNENVILARMTVKPKSHVIAWGIGTGCAQESSGKAA
jgi:hypothetical protein